MGLLGLLPVSAAAVPLGGSGPVLQQGTPTFCLRASKNTKAELPGVILLYSSAWHSAALLRSVVKESDTVPAWVQYGAN